MADRRRPLPSPIYFHVVFGRSYVFVLISEKVIKCQITLFKNCDVTQICNVSQLMFRNRYAYGYQHFELLLIIKFWLVHKFIHRKSNV